MAETNSFLILRLEAPLQAWGDHSKWDRRETAAMPSKSGITGLLACALGLERESDEIASLSQHLSIAVRADRPGVITTDYQTVTGMYQTESGPALLNAAMKKRSGSATFISRREYLQDASFLVVLQIGSQWHGRVCEALQAPHWPVFLGRRNCVPTRPVFEAETDRYSDMISVLKSWPLADRAELPVRFECERADDGLLSYSRTDERLPGYRNFAQRHVFSGTIAEVTPCI